MTAVKSPPQDFPPAQVLTEKIPVAGETRPAAEWSKPAASLSSEGLVRHLRQWSLAELAAFGEREHIIDIHGVTALSATRFFRDFPNGRRLAARVDGLKVLRPSGLLDDQLHFLLENGVGIAFEN